MYYGTFLELYLDHIHPVSHTRLWGLEELSFETYYEPNTFQKYKKYYEGLGLDPEGFLSIFLKSLSQSYMDQTESEGSQKNILPRRS